MKARFMLMNWADNVLDRLAPEGGGAGGVLGDGEQLHNSIPPSKWVVTRRDLKVFRRQVRKAIQDGEIVPTERDPFEPGDNDHGPNVYSVTEQWIKKVTRAAGSMSWALMRHPSGEYECDVFVTHCWAEGIFCFIDKLLTSWPIGRRAAYICFLSNPQNLDITRLVSTPKESPFHKALSAAPTMIVVANPHASIYTRIWCVYEAYVAYAQDKLILGSTRPILRKALRSFGPFLLIYLVTAAGMLTLVMVLPSSISDIRIHPFSPPDHVQLDNYGICDTFGALNLVLAIAIALVFTLVVVLSRAAACPQLVVFSLRSIAVLSGIVGGGVFARLLGPDCREYGRQIGVCEQLARGNSSSPCAGWQQDFLAEHASHHIRPWHHEHSQPHHLDLVVDPFHVLAIMSLGLCFFGEYDRVLTEEFHLESRYLSNGFSTIQDAQSTEPRDKDAIWAEINSHGEHSADQVDAAVHTLLVAGMSEPSLQKAQRRGIVIRDAGLFLAMPFFFCMSVLLWAVDCSVGPVRTRIHEAIFVVWCLVFFYLPPASRAFAILVVFKVCVLGDGLVLMLYYAVLMCLGTASLGLFSDAAFINIATSLFSFFLSIAGMGRVAEIPGVGRYLVSIIASSAPPS